MGQKQDRQRFRAVTDRTLVDESQHWIYAGVTQTGKTTLARWHARILAKAKHRVIVYDPVVETETAGGSWPREAVIYTDAAKFSEAMRRESDAFVFVDEAADVLGHANPENQWMLRRGRHQLLYFRLMVQRVNMIPPNVRTQCARLFMFRLARKDADMVCADMGHGAEVSSTVLDTGDCIMIESGRVEIEQFNCFDIVN